ncbi:Protein of unknown function [Catalinimonas alkaloidigena]|uniref:DUF3823 domain-containing protein n=1 Tax=Catalinimonas alkaloidigena TaxID=1075417 RepID=A0A1G9A4V7_9BACT|nr:DUF3823 domain-containing protein [Catalinimonas alkaloidigena]SDK22382.1 Protein of unknown function [Catalinimonas alkaloidigena]
MTHKYIAAAGVALSFLLGSCAYDNYEAPDAALTGRIVYQGDPIAVEFNQVQFDLYEPGWQKNTPITVTVDQDGSFSALLFNAPYKLVFRPGQGPFMTLADTTQVSVSGNTTFDLEVMPYYMVRNAQFSAPSSTTVSASCSLEKIVTDANAKDVERVTLYVSKTYFVGGGNHIAAVDLGGGDITDPGNISLSAEVPGMVPVQNYVFARIGLKLVNVEDMIFSPIQKVQLGE